MDAGTRGGRTGAEQARVAQAPSETSAPELLEEVLGQKREQRVLGGADRVGRVLELRVRRLVVAVDEHLGRQRAPLFAAHFAPQRGHSAPRRAKSDENIVAAPSGRSARDWRCHRQETSAQGRARRVGSAEVQCLFFVNIHEKLWTSEAVPRLTLVEHPGPVGLSLAFKLLVSLSPTILCVWSSYYLHLC